MTHTKIITEQGTHRVECNDTKKIVNQLREADDDALIYFEGYRKNKDKWIKAGKVTMVTDE